MSRYSQVEQDNNSRFDELANKLSTFRNINSEIQASASQSSVFETLEDQFNSLQNSMKSTSKKLKNSLSSRTSIWRYVFITLVLFFVLYTIYKIMK